MMNLKDLRVLRGSINEDRHSMYKLAEKRGISDSQVIKVSQKLDRKIILLQKVIYDNQFL
ncbi:Spo0E like sporulation regulatory protein [Peribacillus simplex]|uniref:Spo0E like sporulation regulatory protein n=1 Tax=Peribacillus simplex TaxID=1478 RepID=A0A9X8RDL3_9BACI|nr:aspartyl-phosphate phosphatase Spo0E family protein [Peribacillus simplex]SIS01446.1 Spo0E like sporulation regulatory protein [Peribacillus simplex]